ncbi:ATP/GTP-binding family protein [Corynebacterium mustelae]|uniref:ATP/GTP-binding family protein n=1 Tax=Corynebacterium mustelae TaxID=571915 RepID=UPI0006412923|nr:ATP/GTP-binding family protein [Corynebacterium mustelae]
MVRVDFAEFHQQVLEGQVDVPGRFTSTGRAYRRWVKQNERLVSRAERRAKLAAGAVPVVGEKAFSVAGPGGFSGRWSGNAAVISGPQEWQTTTNLGAGFNPNVVGAPAPAIGTPIGVHVTTGAEVACDALGWFREGIISNPSLFLLSLPGLGKSTLVRKMLMGGVAQGHIPIIAGDIKGEYVGFVNQVGGQVIRVGHGVGHINPLDVGALGRVIPQLEQRVVELVSSGAGDQAVELEGIIRRAKEQVHGRQVTMVATLVGLGRGDQVRDWETMLVSVALREIYEREAIDWEHPPVLSDLIGHLERGSDELFSKGRVRTKDEWSLRVDDLLLSLNSLLDGPTGQIFAGESTTPIRLDSTAVCIDVSSIDRGDSAMKAAVMMACWSAAFGAIEAAHMLTDAGLAPQRYFSATLDELWQVLSAAPGMVSHVDALTRLNRTDATVLHMITHTFKDLEALPTEEDRKTAMGFIERAGMVICGGLPNSELEILSNRLEFSPAEAQMVTSWSKGAPPKRARTRGARATPVGRGRFMIKPSKDGSPGIPVQTILTPTEIEYRLHDTNVRFDDFFSAGE